MGNRRVSYRGVDRRSSTRSDGILETRPALPFWFTGLTWGKAELMNDDEDGDKTEVHRVITEKSMSSGETDAENKKSKVSKAAKEASRADDTVV